MALVTTGIQYWSRWRTLSLCRKMHAYVCGELRTWGTSIINCGHARVIFMDPGWVRQQLSATSTPPRFLPTWHINLTMTIVKRKVGIFYTVCPIIFAFTRLSREWNRVLQVGFGWENHARQIRTDDEWKFSGVASIRSLSWQNTHTWNPTKSRRNIQKPDVDLFPARCAS